MPNAGIVVPPFIVAPPNAVVPPLFPVPFVAANAAPKIPPAGAAAGVALPPAGALLAPNVNGVEEPPVLLPAAAAAAARLPNEGTDGVAAAPAGAAVFCTAAPNVNMPVEGGAPPAGWFDGAAPAPGAVPATAFPKIEPAVAAPDGPFVAAAVAAGAFDAPNVNGEEVPVVPAAPNSEAGVG